jgi:GrpB-like predicted nucleotidyltransferase (UPF0157 family)
VLPEQEPVVVVDYDADWPHRYEEERARIVSVLGGLAVAVEHVGSTAVPGLGGKPVIDIMVGVRRLEDGQRCVGPLEGLGYEYLGELGIPGRLYFRRGLPREYQIHLVEHGGEFWERHLLFRDFLRTDPETAAEYHRLKKELALKFRSDREEYTEAKTAFIRSVEERARSDQAL